MNAKQQLVMYCKLSKFPNKVLHTKQLLIHELFTFLIPPLKIFSVT